MGQKVNQLILEHARVSLNARVECVCVCVCMCVCCMYKEIGKKEKKERNRKRKIKIKKNKRGKGDRIIKETCNSIKYFSFCLLFNPFLFFLLSYSF